MKTLSRILLLLMLCFCTMYVLVAQTWDLQFVTMANNGTNYDVKVQMKSNTSNFQLGSANFQFTFNNASLSTPTILTAHNFTNTTNAAYSAMTITTPSPNTISINIVLNTDNSGTEVATSYTDMVTIRFTTTNPAGNSNLEWNSGHILWGVFLGDNATDISANYENLNPLNTSPLPVELTNFTATANRLDATLQWSTATETNNNGFDVERRLVGSNAAEWTKVGFVSGSGTKSSPTEYSYADKNVTPGRYAYRIKQIDNDGLFQYSGSAEVEIVPPVFAVAQNYPNPFNPSTTILFDLPEQSFVSLKIFDITGREVAAIVSEVLPSGSHSRIWNASNLSSGIYFYRLQACQISGGQAGSFTATKKLMLLK